MTDDSDPRYFKNSTVYAILWSLTLAGAVIGLLIWLLPSATP